MNTLGIALGFLSEDEAGSLASTVRKINLEKYNNASTGELF